MARMTRLEQEAWRIHCAVLRARYKPVPGESLLGQVLLQLAVAAIVVAAMAWVAQS